MDNYQLTTTLERLRESSLFHLFLSSKELFHSNFLYWLGRKNPEETGRLFCPELSLRGETRIEREKRFRVKKNGKEQKATVDIALFEGDNPRLVVENKVKDVAREDQLLRIKGSLDADGSVCFVLLSLLPSNSASKSTGWNFLSYSVLAERLDPVPFRLDDFERALLDKYKQLIFDLTELVDNLPLGEYYDFAKSQQEPLYHLLNASKLWEMYQRFRASHLMEEFTRQSNLADQLELGYSINNQKATMDFKWKFGPDEKYRVGVQIEDNQYRTVLEGPRIHELGEALRKENVLFDSSWKSSHGNSLLRYGSTFRYQYGGLDGKPLRFDEFFARIEQTLRDQEKLIPEIERLI